MTVGELIAVLQGFDPALPVKWPAAHAYNRIVSLGLGRRLQVEEDGIVTALRDFDKAHPGYEHCSVAAVIQILTQLNDEAPRVDTERLTWISANPRSVAFGGSLGWRPVGLDASNIRDRLTFREAIDIARGKA